jgi:hypothetical protein
MKRAKEYPSSAVHPWLLKGKIEEQDSSRERSSSRNKLKLVPVPEFDTGTSREQEDQRNQIDRREFN